MATTELDQDEILTKVASVESGTRPIAPTYPWERSLVARLIRDVDALPPYEASLPINVVSTAPAPNVFELPRQPSDPPPIWDVLPRPPQPATIRPRNRRKLPPRRTSLVPVVVAAALGAITMGLWLDPTARGIAFEELRSITSFASTRL